MWKQVIIVRKDLKLSKGKLAAQVAHASLGAYKQSGYEEQTEWEAWGSKKVVLKAENLKELLELQKSAKKAKIAQSLIKDAGLTEVKPGTVTALAIGPALEEELDRLTGHLKML